MSEDISDQKNRHWKQQYYDQLDLLDQKEKDWQALESILKKTVLRLSITAEGQHATIDRYLHDVRSVVKKQVDIIRLENILNDISALVLKMGDKQVTADKKVTTMLIRLLEKIDFPDAASKQKNKLIKKLSRSTDKNSNDLADEVQSLLSVFINHASTDPVSINPASVNHVADSSHEQAKYGFLKNLFKSQSGVEEQRSHTTSDKEDDSKSISLQAYKDKDEAQSATPDLADSSYKQRLQESEPSAQDVLVRLLEQLLVPPDWYEAVENIKLRIKTDKPETGKAAASWKRLLNDIAQLVNSLRSGIQDEKQGFETFLQQITGRLKEMDSFLLQENALLGEAEQAGGVFDAAVSAQVQDIHDDIKISDNLNDLKNKVKNRLSVISDHIKQYRINERERFTNAQQNVEKMQSRLQQLEQEADDLRKLLLVKNKEAMFDVLTKIPNRLAYEKKAVEEIGRCKRFATSLSMAVWDIDLFKQVNDTYGHKVGDMVLKAVARLLNERMRETDFIARYGGEEFVMFLPGADEAKALVLADALREKLSVCKFKHYDEMIEITVSCGITSFIEGDNHESMFERADKALYAAKHNGRNKCVAASSL